MTIHMISIDLEIEAERESSELHGVCRAATSSNFPANISELEICEVPDIHSLLKNGSYSHNYYSFVV